MRKAHQARRCFNGASDLVRYKVTHTTSYRYSQPVSVSHHLLHLKPRATPHQRVDRLDVAMTPHPASLSEGVDYFGNPRSFITVDAQHDEIEFHAQSLVEVSAPEPPEPALTPAWESVYPHLERDTSPEMLGVLQFVFPSSGTAASVDLADFARPSFPPGRPVLEAALDLTGRIYSQFAYDGTATTVTTPVDEVMQLKRGVCQDFAHLQIGCLRALGLPARYVSGYLLTYPPPGEEKLVGADASHAWLSLWVPGFGWIDLDPTNNKVPRDEHVTLGWGRDYGDVSPINGVIFGGGPHVVEVSVDVAPQEGG